MCDWILTTAMLRVDYHCKWYHWAWLMIRGVQTRYRAGRAYIVLGQWGAATARPQSAVGCLPKCSDLARSPMNHPANPPRGSIFWIVVLVFLFFLSMASSLLFPYPEPPRTQSSASLFRKIEAFPHQLPSQWHPGCPPVDKRVSKMSTCVSWTTTAP